MACVGRPGATWEPARLGDMEPPSARPFTHPVDCGSDSPTGPAAAPARDQKLSIHEAARLGLVRWFGCRLEGYQENNMIQEN